MRGADHCREQLRRLKPIVSRRRLTVHERPVDDLLRTREIHPCARRSYGSMRYKRGYPHLKGLGSTA